MADLKEYEIQINGIPHTVQLSDEDAKRAGDSAKPVSKAAKAPANKAAATPENK